MYLYEATYSRMRVQFRGLWFYKASISGRPPVGSGSQRRGRLIIRSHMRARDGKRVSHQPRWLALYQPLAVKT